MFRVLHILFALLVIGLGAIGLSRLNFNVNLMKLLPANLPGVAGTAAFQKFHERPNELLVTIQSTDGAETGDFALDLAERLAAEPGLAASVQSEPAWLSAPAGLVELTAHAWLNSPPERVLELEAALAPERIGPLLDARIGSITGSINPLTEALDSRDPLGLGAVLRELGESIGEASGGDGFATADGTFHLLKVTAAEPLNGYRAASEWIARVDAVVRAWQQVETGAAALEIAYTGSPAFEAEIGTGMEHDMKQSVSGISVVVGLLFWFLYRRLKPLVLLMLAMAATSLLTLGVAGLTFGTLDVMSMGFAAILMGMIEDFGVMGLQEAVRRPEADFRAVHAGVFPPVAWSALTAAAVFGTLGFSALPGIARMGVLTALGILIGAAVMLYGFLPLAMQHRSAPITLPAFGGGRRWANWPGWLAMALAVSSAGVLAVRGLPAVVQDTDILRPRQCQAFDALEQLQRRMQNSRDLSEWLPVVVQGDTEAHLASSMRWLEKALARAAAEGRITGRLFPSALVPDPARQAANLPVLTRLAAARPRLEKAMDAAGFTPEGMVFTQKVLETFGDWGRNPLAAVRWPGNALLESHLGPFLRRDAAGASVCGFVRLAPGIDPGQAAILEEIQQDPRVKVGGLGYLSGQLKRLLRGEVLRVLLPAVGVLSCLLFLVFKSRRERLMAVASLTFSGLVLLGGMSAVGLSWNFVSIGAVPLVLGLGLDFNIHMLIALRKRGADGHGIGQALAYCGFSTGLGFGALGFSGNIGLASFGQTAMIGVLAALFTAAFIVPWVWQRIGEPQPKLADGPAD